MEWLQRLHRRLLPDDPGIGWTPYLWLVYLSFFFIRYFFVVPTAGEVVAIIATLVVFLVLYFNGYWKRGWALVPNIAGIALIGTVWAATNEGAGVFFIYAASFAGWIGPPSRAAFAVGIVLSWAGITAGLVQPHPTFWVPALLFGSLIGMVNIYYAGQQRKSAALRLSQEEVRTLAQVAERERISRDLHDLLGHTLSVIALKAELAGKLIDRDPGRAAEEIREVERVSRSALAQVRDAVTGFRQRGLAGELEHARVALKAAAVELTVDGEPPRMPPELEAVVALVLREAVTNVIRHAQANHCRILLRAEAGELMLEVKDDGRGAPQATGGGIDGMRTRIAEVGGRFEIAEDYGTRIRAWVPLA